MKAKCLMLHNDIQKNMVDTYLKELAKEFKRLTGRKASAEIIIVGGGSALLNYDFRMNSVDVDAFNTYEKHNADGMLYFLKHVDCNAVFPMHYWNEPSVIDRFIIEYPQYKSRIKNTESAKGEEI